MRNKNIYIGTIILGLLSFTLIRCDDNVDPLVEELTLSRVLAPTELIARVRNLTTIELTWTPRADADHYIVEFSEDNLEFNTIIHTATVTAEDLPYQKTFDGETLYSARVKGVSASGVEDSKWVAVSITTAQENIFLPQVDGDVAATEATVRWPANSEVTHFIITPGDVERTITAEEKAAGVATITGLTGEINYVVVLKKETKHRGSVSFTTLIDLGGATPVHPEDDLNAVITAALPGDVLVLFPGDYTVYTGAITLNKSISIKGLYPYDKPKLHVQFNLENGVSDVTVRDLDLGGDATLTDVFKYNTESLVYGSLNIVACTIHDFTRSLVAATSLLNTKIASVSIENCVMTDILTTSGDFIDFRTPHVTAISVTNSTFDNCSPARDFIRVDNVAPAASGFSGTGLTSTVLIDHCTIFKPATGAANRRLTYVRFSQNVVTVKNTIIAETTGYYTNQTSTTQPVCLNNNYFNAPRFHDAATEVIANLKIDNSGTHTTLDPGFTDAANGNFTVSNQTIKDNNVGDPRWLQ
jgi:hypothetical protein